MTPVAAALEPSLVRVGTLSGLTANGTPVVFIRGDEPLGAVEARTCVPVHADDVGREIVLLWDRERPDSPVVLGVIRPPVAAEGVRITADGTNVTLTAREGITLECGEARITLHRSGKIVIRGAHVVSHSSGVNRIRGGSVQLN